MVAIAIAAYAINVAHIQYTRAEMQIVNDVSTRAACRALVDTGSQNQAYLAAPALGRCQQRAERTLTIAPGDLQLPRPLAPPLPIGMPTQPPTPNPNSVRYQQYFLSTLARCTTMLMPSFNMAMGFRPIKEATAATTDLDIGHRAGLLRSMLTAWNQTAGPEACWSCRYRFHQQPAGKSPSPSSKRCTAPSVHRLRKSAWPLRLSTKSRYSTCRSAPDYLAIESALAFPQYRLSRRHVHPGRRHEQRHDGRC